MEEGMHIVENRVASFTEAKSAWPHPDTYNVAPLNLAEAGFYFDPHYPEDDSCVCFLCQKSLGGWEEQDDPIVEHITHAPFCAWAKLICSRLFVSGAVIPLENYDEDDYLPTSSFMEAARAATFQDFWPHENKKGWLCNVKKMAKAGFHYNPTPDSDDTACCTYCNTTLDGWEPRDSPVKEHRKRAPTCPFFSKDLKATLKNMREANEKQNSIVTVETVGSDAEKTTTSTTTRREAARNSSSSETSQSKGRKRSKKQQDLNDQSEGATSEQGEDVAPSSERSSRDSRKRKKVATTQEPIADMLEHKGTEPMETNTSKLEESQCQVNESEQGTPKNKKSKGMTNDEMDTSEKHVSIAYPDKSNVQEESSEPVNSVAQHFELIAKNLMGLQNDEAQSHENTDISNQHVDDVSEVLSAVSHVHDDMHQETNEQLPVSPGPDRAETVFQQEETPVNGVLSEDEQKMTVEQFIRSLIDKQVKKLEVESEARIAQFIQEADKIKSMIAAMES